MWFSGIFWLMGSSPHHRGSSQTRPGKSHAREWVERKHRGERKPGVPRSETGWVDCMLEVQLGTCAEALSSRRGRVVRKQAERWRQKRTVAVCNQEWAKNPELHLRFCS